MKPFSPPIVLLYLLLMSSFTHAKSDIDDLDAADRAEFQRRLNGSDTCVAKGDWQCGRAELLAAKKFAISEKERALVRKKEDDLTFTYERQARVDAKLKYEHERAAVDRIAEQSILETEEIRRRSRAESRSAEAARSAEERAINNNNRKNAERWQAEEKQVRQRSLADIKRVLDRENGRINAGVSTGASQPGKAGSNAAQPGKADLADRSPRLAASAVAHAIPATARQNADAPVALPDRPVKTAAPAREANAYERFPTSQFWGEPTPPWLSVQASLATRAEACNAATTRRAKSISNDEQRGFVRASNLSSCICQTNAQPGGLATEPGWLCAVYWQVEDTGKKRGTSAR